MSAAASTIVLEESRDLASLYTGFLDSRALVALGMLEGTEQALEALDGAFASAAPWRGDMF